MNSRRVLPAFSAALALATGLMMAPNASGQTTTTPLVEQDLAIFADLRERGKITAFQPRGDKGEIRNADQASVRKQD